MYFRRALKLDRHYLSAWTLMGHEYVEMKNTSAAIGQFHPVLSDIHPLILLIVFRMSLFRPDETMTAMVLSLPAWHVCRNECL